VQTVAVSGSYECKVAENIPSTTTEAVHLAGFARYIIFDYTYSPGLRGGMGRPGLPSFRPVPPQIFLSGHANSVLQNRLSLCIPTMSLLAEETVRYRPTLLRKRTTVRLAISRWFRLLTY